MQNNKKLGLFAWGIGFGLSNLLLFCLNTGYTASFWCTFIFVWVASISSLFFQAKSWRQKNKPRESLLHISLLIIAIGYMVIQIPVCIVMSLLSSLISLKAAILINGIICVIAWLMGIGSLVGNNHIDKVNMRQH